jgi:hypothetical protein
MLRNNEEKSAMKQKEMRKMKRVSAYKPMNE